MDLDKLDDIVNFADNMAVKLAAEYSKKLKNISANKKKKLLKEYSNKKATLERYIHSAPFTRLSDKITFIYGVLAVIIQAFVYGRYPNNLYFHWHSFFITIQIFLKWVYYKRMGWHYYMSDFCYIANALILLFLNFYPKNDLLFITCFLYSNGALAIAVGAFRNQMVFHKFDNMTSLALHMYPQLLSYILRWNTMPFEKTLPEEER